MVWLYSGSPAIVPHESTNAPGTGGEFRIEFLNIDPGEDGSGIVNLVVRCGAVPDCGYGWLSPSLTVEVDTGRKLPGVDKSGFEIGRPDDSDDHEPVK